MSSHICVCGKSYAFASSLCVHRKKCAVYLENPCSSKKKRNNIKLKITEKIIDDVDDDIKSMSSLNSNASSARIIELETDLKFKEMETEYKLKLKDVEFENQLKLKNMELQIQKLEFQIQMKDFEIEMIKKLCIEKSIQESVVQVPIQQPVVQVPIQQPVVQVPIQQPVVQEKTPKPSTQDFLNNNFKEALTIENCFDILKNPDYNHYLFEETFDDNGTIKCIIHPKFSLKNKYNSWTTNAIDIIAALLYKFEKQELPFYICRKNKKSCLYIKTNNGWFKSSETEVDDLLLKFCNKAVSSVGMAISNTYEIFKKMPSKYGEIFNINKEDNTACNFDQWQLHHKTEIISNLFAFKEDFDVAVKKLKHLMCKFGSISTDTDNSEEE